MSGCPSSPNVLYADHAWWRPSSPGRRRRSRSSRSRRRRRLPRTSAGQSGSFAMPTWSELRQDGRHRPGQPGAGAGDGGARRRKEAEGRAGVLQGYSEGGEGVCQDEEVLGMKCPGFLYRCQILLFVDSNLLLAFQLSSFTSLCTLCGSHFPRASLRSSIFTGLLM